MTLTQLLLEAIDPPTIGYHITYLANLSQIKKEGLRGNRRQKLKVGKELAYIWLMVSPSLAHEIAISLNMNRRKDWVLLKVKNLSPEYLRGDADFVDDLKSNFTTMNWRQSIKRAGTFAYAGAIFPNQISVYKTAKETENERHDEFRELEDWKNINKKWKKY